MKDFQKVNRNKCLFCNKVFCCAQCLTKHETITHCSECQICVHGKLVFRENTVPMVEHIELVHLPLHCVLCKKIFTNIDEVRTHRVCPAAGDVKVKLSEYDSPPISDFNKKFFMDCEKITPSLLDKKVITTSTPVSAEDDKKLPSMLVNFSADSNKESIISDSSLTNIIKSDQSRHKSDKGYHVTFSRTPKVKSEYNDQASFELHQSSLNICSINNSGKKERPILKHTKPLREANYHCSSTLVGKESIITGSCYVKKITSEVRATTSTPISRSEKYFENNSDDPSKEMPTQQIYKMQANENKNSKQVVTVVTPGLETCKIRQPLQDKFMEEDISHINKVLATPENNTAINNMKNLSEASTRYFTAKKELLMITYKESEFISTDEAVTEAIVEEFDVDVTVPNPDNTLWVSAMNEQTTIPDKIENNTNSPVMVNYSMTAKNKTSNMCSMLTSFTQMVKEFVSSGPSSSATSFKRCADEPLDNGYNYKRMKINDIKCRPTIRRICPITHRPVIMVDKETQTD